MRVLHFTCLIHIILLLPSSTISLNTLYAILLVITFVIMVLLYCLIIRALLIICILLNCLNIFFLSIIFPRVSALIEDWLGRNILFLLRNFGSPDYEYPEELEDRRNSLTVSVVYFITLVGTMNIVGAEPADIFLQLKRNPGILLELNIHLPHLPPTSGLLESLFRNIQKSRLRRWLWSVRRYQR